MRFIENWPRNEARFLLIYTIWDGAKTLNRSSMLDRTDTLSTPSSYPSVYHPTQMDDPGPNPRTWRGTKVFTKMKRSLRKKTNITISPCISFGTLFRSSRRLARSKLNLD